MKNKNRENSNFHQEFILFIYIRLFSLCLHNINGNNKDDGMKQPSMIEVQDKSNI